MSIFDPFTVKENFLSASITSVYNDTIPRGKSTFLVTLTLRSKSPEVRTPSPLTQFSHSQWVPNLESFRVVRETPHEVLERYFVHKVDGGGRTNRLVTTNTIRLLSST